MARRRVHVEHDRRRQLVRVEPDCRGVGFGFRTDTQAVVNWILATVAAHAPGEVSDIDFVER